MNKWIQSHIKMPDRSVFISFRNIVFFLLLLSLCHVSFASLTTIADKIQTKIESNLYQLKPNIQSHYAVRMYRLTGNNQYLYPIIFYQLVASIQYKHLLSELKPAQPFPQEKLLLPDNFNDMSTRTKRKYILQHFPQIKLRLKLLYILSVASQLNLIKSPFYPNAGDTIKLLKQNSASLKHFLLNPVLIKYASPQFANYAYILRDLKIIDITHEYQDAFRKTFPDNKDNSLNNKEYNEKIYGMTHIILAASDYYQHKVSRKQFNWIYDYFDSHMDEFLSRLKYDVLIEVGLCYLLADNITDPKPIETIKEYVVTRFNPKTNLISEPWDNNKIYMAEHRNVLTILFIRWSDKLYSGPDLLNSKRFNATFKPLFPL